MDFVVSEILVSMAVVAVIAGIVGWLLRGVRAQQALIATEGDLNDRIVELQSEVENDQKTKADYISALEKSTAQNKDSEEKVAELTKQLVSAKEELDTSKS